jgi:uncharacterized protein
MRFGGRKNTLMLGGAALLAAEIGRRIYRRSQLFLPSPDPVKTWNPADYGIPDGAVEEHWIDTPDGERLHAWYCRVENPKATGIFCHGNTGNLTVSADIIPHLLDANFNVLFFDYRGFGKSSGRASLGGVIADGITAARYHEKIRPRNIPSVLYGFSLGGAIASQVIRKHPFDALILQSTFTSLSHLARVLHPRLAFLSGTVFNTLAVVKRLQVPLLVLHGTADEVCPCAMAHQIFDSCPSPQKRIHCVDGGLHKDLYLRDADALIWAISQFVAELPNGTRTTSVDEIPALEEWAGDAAGIVRGLFGPRRPQRA